MKGLEDQLLGRVILKEKSVSIKDKFQYTFLCLGHLPVNIHEIKLNKVCGLKLHRGLGVPASNTNSLNCLT